MPGRNSTFVFSALALLAGVHAQAESDPTPCAVNVDVKAPEWQAACEAAIASEPDAKRRAPLLFGRAYGAVERFRYDDAIADLDAALAADPDNADYLRERAYVHGELSDFDQAIADLDRFIALKPDDPSGFRERSYARHYHGDLKGSYDDRARVFELTPDSLQSLIARAEAALWLGRLDEAAKDAASAEGQAKAFNEAAAQGSAADLLSRIKHWREASRGSGAAQRCSEAKAIHKGSASKLIGDCSRAFLEAKTGSAKAVALTTRSIAWLVVVQSQTSATEDMKMALAFDPGNIERHINLGYSYLSSSLSWAANREFERALAIEKHWLALAGRAAARVNLGDTDGALADARESQQIHPNEAAGSVLADIAYEKGDRDRARALYLEVYRLGSRSDRLLQRLSELDVPDPERAIKK